jgi:meiotic recombination protein SPO11
MSSDSGRLVVQDAAAASAQEKPEYVLLKNLDRETVMSKIQEILKQEEMQVVEDKKGRFWFRSRRGKKAVVFDTEKQHWCLIRRRLYLCSVDKGRYFLRVWHKIKCALLADTVTTPRDIFFFDSALFGKKKNIIDQIISDLCCTVGCTRDSLHVIPPTRGRIIGDIKLLTESDDLCFDCGAYGLGGAPIPKEAQQVRQAVAYSDKAIQFILVVEKETVFTDLASARFHKHQCCVILTGCGEPELATRRILNVMATSIKVPVYALVDPDPHGLLILLTYKYGSQNMAFHNDGHTVPDIGCIGVHSSYLLDHVHKSHHQELSKRDKTILDNILKMKHIQEDDHLYSNAIDMRLNKIKGEIEYLLHMDPESHLPSLVMDLINKVNILLLASICAFIYQSQCILGTHLTSVLVSGSLTTLRRK